MENLLDKIQRLADQHDRLDPELVKKKDIKLGLRNTDGTGVVAGITSKGQVTGYEKDADGKPRPVPGKLFYCGYDVEDISRSVEADLRFGFEETIYLLLTGALPTAADLESFRNVLGERRGLPLAAKEIIKYNSMNDDQMGALHAAVAALHKFDTSPRSTNIRDVTRQCVDIIAKFPTIIAYNYNVMRSTPSRLPLLVEPDPALSAAENFLYMLKGEKAPDWVAHAFDIALILHADHGGGNNSTFAVRTVSSALTDTYMALCAGVASLAGHLHGGANEAVMNMMEGIKGGVRDWKDRDEVRAYLQGLMDGKLGDRSGKIYGIGHAVYTVSDPREIILRAKSKKFAEQLGRLEEFALYEMVADLGVDVVKSSKGKNVCANVDFFSGFMYDMMGIPQELFTPIFAMSRVAGWSAHRIEEIIQGRLIRPAFVSTISETLPYVPLAKRN